MEKNSPTSSTVALKDGKVHLQFMFFVVLLLSPTLPTVGAQPNPNNNFNNNNNGVGFSNFSPSMAIIIVVLVAALFFMAFFSIYIRHCSDNSGSSVRNALNVHTRRANAAPRGLEPPVIETFPTFTYAEVKDHKIGKGALECAVCLNEFEESETLRLIPKCDHVFHPECIDAWLQSHVTCPVCRANLTPQPGDESYHPPEAEGATSATNNQENQENNNNPPRNDEVTIQIPDSQERREEPKPAVKRNFSFDFARRPPRTESVRRGRSGFPRSHSTGHSLVQPGENVDRFTLRLPERIRKQMMNRALLNRTKSFAGSLPRDGSSRTGSRPGLDEGSSRGGRSFRRIERGDRVAISDRWIFSRAPSFFSRALSIRSPRVVADNAEDSTSKAEKTTVGMPSFNCLEPKTADETGLVAADSARPPV